MIVPFSGSKIGQKLPELQTFASGCYIASILILICVTFITQYKYPNSVQANSLLGEKLSVYRLRACFQEMREKLFPHQMKLPQ